MHEKFEIIRRNWNERTPIHAASSFYNVHGFKSGNITLTEIERRELGSVNGKTLLHLQCHFGMDTMSWARLGAIATGVDISDAAIELARELNDEVNLDVRFIRSNIYDLPQVLDEQFDIVYTAIGALCWLPDMTGWAQIVARYLKPGGTFYILDGHPVSHIFEPVESPDGVIELKPCHSYFPNPEGIAYEGGGYTYTGSDVLETPSHEWQHSMSDIVNALIRAGLKIEWLNEFAVSGFRAFPQMSRHDDGWWRLDEAHGTVPFLFSIKATQMKIRPSSELPLVEYPLECSASAVGAGVQLVTNSK